MTLPLLLGGILAAAFVFGAMLYALVQATRTSGMLRLAHIACIVLTVAGMAAIQFLAPTLAAVAGIALVCASLVAAVKEPGFGKLLPLILTLLGILLASGAPFSA